VVKLSLFIATGNTHKVEEMEKILSTFGIGLQQKNLLIIEPDFDSLEEIALEKAKQAFKVLKAPVIGEDTGVYFEAYNNFPGQLAKRVYLGLGFEGLLALINAKPNKKAHFKTAVAFFDGKTEKVFSGKLPGTLLDKAVSVEKNRLPYEKMFVPKGYADAIVNMSLEEKNKISHRAIATRKFAEWYSKEFL